jgi:hypothetical protein
MRRRSALLAGVSMGVACIVSCGGDDTSVQGVPDASRGDAPAEAAPIAEGGVDGRVANDGALWDVAVDVGTLDARGSDAPSDVDGKPGSTCCPLHCWDYGFQCGAWPDSCGGVMECGFCLAPQTCGGGGQMGICGP